jgi:hypothetical protein
MSSRQGRAYRLTPRRGQARPWRLIIYTGSLNVSAKDDVVPLLAAIRSSHSVSAITRAGWRNDASRGFFARRAPVPARQDAGRDSAQTGCSVQSSFQFAPAPHPGSSGCPRGPRLSGYGGSGNQCNATASHWRELARSVSESVVDRGDATN